MKKSENINSIPCEIVPEELENVTGGIGGPVVRVLCKLMHSALPQAETYCLKCCKWRNSINCSNGRHYPAISDDEIIEDYKSIYERKRP